jgi:periplasmic divalent cation tolerance protein
MTSYLQVTTATDNKEAALALARSVIKARLAAGAQVVGPVASVFWHHGSFGEGEEWQAIFKTTFARYADLEAHLVAQHPWANPEVVAIPIVHGSQPYLNWLSETLDQG